MASTMTTDYPPPLTSDQLAYLLSNLKDWAILNGLAVRPSREFISEDVDPSGSLAVPAPVTLFPSLFPRKCFEEAKGLQNAFNELYASIASDEGWLSDNLAELLEVDDFIAKLWDIHLKVKNEGYPQDISLGLFRSDYMIHQDPSDLTAKPEIKQVEFNTIASSFGGLASKVSALHNYLRSIVAYPAMPHLPAHHSSVPENPCISLLSSGLAEGHEAYGPSKSSPPLPLCILFVVQSSENNVFDQIALSTRLIDHHGIPTHRLPFSSVPTHTSISSRPTRPLIYRPPQSSDRPYEVSLLYFRACYSPADFNFPGSWEARLQLERAAAIKCPSILTQLAGSKKIQQILAAPATTHLTRFSRPNSQNIDRMRRTFAEIYPLDDSPAGQRAIALATDPASATRYVLKPQREGGGNNIYGAKIPPFLKSLGDDRRKWRAYILMELIQPPAAKNSIFRNGVVKSGEVIGELGVYGVCLWRSPKGTEPDPFYRDVDIEEDERSIEILSNYAAGWLLRTKGRESEEGGVAAGFGAIDSIYMVK